MSGAVLYLRVSKDDGSQDLGNQRPHLEQMAAARGLAIVATYTDEMSGAKGQQDRPGLAQLMQDAARGKFRAVLVWALDRFSRDGSFLGGLMMVGELDRFGVSLLSYQETYIDTAGPFREPLVALALKIAQQERSRLIERTRAGVAHAKKHGTKSGRPFGRPRVEIKPAAIVRAGALRLAGKSWRDCASIVKQEGLGDYDNATLRREVLKRGGQHEAPKAA